MEHIGYRQNTIIVGLILLSLMSIGFTQLTFADEKHEVAVTILPQAEFAEQITAGLDFEILVLIPPGASPATYELAPRQMKILSRIPLYFKLGSGLPFEDVWLGKISDLNESMVIINCSKGIEILSGAHSHHDDQHSTHHMQDPHIWCSPLNAMIIIDNMVDGFIKAYPEYDTLFRKNAHSYKQQLENLNQEISKLFEKKNSRKFIVFHPAWGYFANEYRLTQIPIEIEGKEPRASSLRVLIETARSEEINIVFASPQFNSESARMIASEINGEVEFIDSLGKDYINNMREIAIKLAKAMQ